MITAMYVWWQPETSIFNKVTSPTKQHHIEEKGASVHNPHVPSLHIYIKRRKKEKKKMLSVWFCSTAAVQSCFFRTSLDYKDRKAVARRSRLYKMIVG